MYASPKNGPRRLVAVHAQAPHEAEGQPAGARRRLAPSRAALRGQRRSMPRRTHRGRSGGWDMRVALVKSLRRREGITSGLTTTVVVPADGA